MTSPDTRSNDVGIKADYYHRAGVPVYVIADVSEDKEGGRQIKLICYDDAPRRYKRRKPNRRGWIWLAPVRLWLELTTDRQGGFLRLACFDPDTEKEIEVLTTIGPEFAEIHAAAQAAQERIRTLEAEIQKLRGQRS